jgi:hypothetical protein
MMSWLMPVLIVVWCVLVWCGCTSAFISHIVTCVASDSLVFRSTLVYSPLSELRVNESVIAYQEGPSVSGLAVVTGIHACVDVVEYVVITIESCGVIDTILATASQPFYTVAPSGGEWGSG